MHLALSEFHKDSSRHLGRSFICRTCDHKKGRKWAKANPSRVALIARNYRERNPERSALIEFRSRLKTKYGLTIEQYDQMVADQNGLCAACNQKPEDQYFCQGLVVDHCHKTKKARALLCSPCNLTLGLARECPTRLRAVAKYIESR